MVSAVVPRSVGGRGDESGRAGDRLVSEEQRVKQRDERIQRERVPAGIVIRAVSQSETKPKISAFIWGGKVRQEPTLPFGRWKPSAV